jgi:hypothetical protein
MPQIQVLIGLLKSAMVTHLMKAKFQASQRVKQAMLSLLLLLLLPILAGERVRRHGEKNNSIVINVRFEYRY